MGRVHDRDRSSGQGIALPQVRVHHTCHGTAAAPAEISLTRARISVRRASARARIPEPSTLTNLQVLQSTSERQLQRFPGSSGSEGTPPDGSTARDTGHCSAVARAARFTAASRGVARSFGNRSGRSSPSSHTMHESSPVRPRSSTAAVASVHHHETDAHASRTATPYGSNREGCRKHPRAVELRYPRRSSHSRNSTCGDTQLRSELGKASSFRTRASHTVDESIRMVAIETRERFQRKIDPLSTSTVRTRQRRWADLGSFGPEHSRSRSTGDCSAFQSGNHRSQRSVAPAHPCPSLLGRVGTRDQPAERGPP